MRTRDGDLHRGRDFVGQIVHNQRGDAAHNSDRSSIGNREHIRQARRWGICLPKYALDSSNSSPSSRIRYNSRGCNPNAWVVRVVKVGGRSATVPGMDKSVSMRAAHGNTSIRQVGRPTGTQAARGAHASLSPSRVAIRGEPGLRDQ